MKLEAGYGNQLSLIFKGDVWEANSRREGPDVVTALEARMGIFDVAGTYTLKTLAAPSTGTRTVSDILKALIGDFPNLSLGAIGSWLQTLTRPVVLNGNTHDLLKKYTGGNVFIDMDLVHCFHGHEAIYGDVPLIDGATGLLQTPVRSDAYLTVTTLLEPRINVGYIAEIRSAEEPKYNGQYKVLGGGASGRHFRSRLRDMHQHLHAHDRITSPGRVRCRQIRLLIPRRPTLSTFSRHTRTTFRVQRTASRSVLFRLSMPKTRRQPCSSL